MSRPITKANDVHVRVGRLVVDRAALGQAGSRGFHDAVADRIAQQLEGADVARAHEAGSRADLSAAIATAVAAQVSPQLSRARRR